MSQPHSPGGGAAAQDYGTTAGHRARKQSSYTLRPFVFLALGLLLVLAAHLHRPALPGPSASESGSLPAYTRSQWTALSSDFIICSPVDPDLVLAWPPRKASRGSIYTGEDVGRTGYVECVAVANGTILAVGSESDVLEVACDARPAHRRKGLPRSNKAERLLRRHQAHQSAPAKACNVRRLKPGQTLFPGFQDAHGHVLDYGWSRTVVDLVGSRSKDEIVQRLEDFVRASPDLLSYATGAANAEPTNRQELRWIEGLGWDQTKWSEPVFPTAADLSRSPLLQRFAISLRRIDVHAIWLSEVALQLVMEGAKGFPHSPADDDKIEGGLVVRDADGKPTGVLIDNAMNLAYQVIPKWTFEQRKKFLNAAAEGLLRSGITAVGDAATDLDAVEFYKRMDKRGQLPLRIYSFLACPPGEPRCADRTKLVVPTAAASSRFTLRSVKLFADGALGSWGSAMWQDYSDKPGERGLLLIREEEVEPLIRYWMERGWQVGTHAIGDKANTLVLEAYESILASSAGSSPSTDGARYDPRPRVEHAQIVRTSDVAQFGSLGVIASMQPTHCTSDMGYVESRIGAERARGAYAWKAVLEHGGRLALGSDFPVELPDPLHGIYSAITRLDPQGDSPSGHGGWYPEQRLSRREALRGFTLDVSYAQYEEDRAGSLRVGKRADFTVLDRDILDEDKVSPAEVRSARVEATFIDGRVAYDYARTAEAQRPATTAPPVGLARAGRPAKAAVEGAAAPPQHLRSGIVATIIACVFLLVAILVLRPGTNSDAYSNLSALALNTRAPAAEWMNMGLWRGTHDFSTAAQQLAELLYAKAKVTAGSRILDVGCATGDSLLLLEQRYGPRTLHGVTFLERDAARASRRVRALVDGKEKAEAGPAGVARVQVWCGDIFEWLTETSSVASKMVGAGKARASVGAGAQAGVQAVAQAEAQYDFILALDCAYHFKSRANFLEQAHRRLAPGGTLALVDLLSAWPPVSGDREREWTYVESGTLRDPQQRPSWWGRLGHGLTCRLLGVSPSALWSPDEYADRLVRAGFAASCVSIEDVSEHVFPGFAQFLRGLGRGEEAAWRGGGTATLVALRRFGGVVERWGEGGDEGLVRCGVVVARKAVEEDQRRDGDRDGDRDGEKETSG
ncbi:hypothetical protein ACQY0O_001188 [Thecaphora frezii]